MVHKNLYNFEILILDAMDVIQRVVFFFFPEVINLEHNLANPSDTNMESRFYDQNHIIRNDEKIIFHMKKHIVNFNI